MSQTCAILPAVAAAIFNNNGCVLLQKRKNNQWGVISGHVEFGEDVETALLREIMEETGLQCRIKRLIGIYSSPQTQTYQTDDKTIQYITHYFEVDLIDPFDATFNSEETHELRFFPPENIPSNLILMHPTWLSDALANEKVFVR